MMTRRMNGRGKNVEEGRIWGIRMVCYVHRSNIITAIWEAHRQLDLGQGSIM
jgi:hypothetical protein